MTTDNSNYEATLEWIDAEDADLLRQADAIDARRDVLKEVRSRLTGTTSAPRAPRKRRGAQQEQQAPSVSATGDMDLRLAMEPAQ